LVSPRHLPRSSAQPSLFTRPVSPIPTRLSRSRLARKQLQN
jgi:hypothetical protein